jgi:subtilisin family serine protease
MHSLLAMVLAASTLIPAAGASPGNAAHVPGRFVVTGSADPSLFASGTDVSSVAGHTVLEVVPGDDPLAQAAALERDYGVEVVPMVMYQLLAGPNREPRFPDQWSLDNRGQTGGVVGADIGMAGAWPWTQGSGVVVAVIDSGIDGSNPEFTGRLWTNPGEIADNGVDDDGNGLIDDVTGWDFVGEDAIAEDAIGHGTAVSSVVAAAVDGSGMTGVAPEARIMTLKACATFGCPADAVAGAIEYAADHGADIINLSLGAPGIEPLVSAAIEHAHARGVLVVAAAGNAGSDLDRAGPWTPVSIEGVVGVAWTDANDVLAGASNYGQNTVALGAPGSAILTANVGGGHEPRTGTSFSAPHVSGVAALILSIAPTLDRREVVEILQETGDRRPSLETAVSSGNRVDATKAVQAARFRDIPGSTFADDIMWAAAEGLTAGCTTRSFCPDSFVTRAQMAAFLSRALDLPDTSTDAFDDDDGSVFEADINRLAAAGITAGCRVNSYCPGEPVTRAQMAALLVRSFDLDAGGGSDVFVDDDGSIFEADIERLAAAGITRGCNPPAADRYCPEDPVTRAQLMAFLRRS